MEPVIPSQVPSQKILTVFLALVTLAFAYQAYAMAALTAKIANTDLNFGGGPSSVNLTSDGSAPSMVGGC